MSFQLDYLVCLVGVLDTLQVTLSSSPVEPLECLFEFGDGNAVLSAPELRVGVQEQEPLPCSLNHVLNERPVLPMLINDAVLIVDDDGSLIR